HLRRISVDALDIEQGAEFFILGLHPGVSHNDIARLEPEPADLAGRHIDIIFTGKIIGTADEAVAVRHDLQDTVCGNAAVQFSGEALLRRYLYCRSLALRCTASCILYILSDSVLYASILCVSILHTSILCVSGRVYGSGSMLAVLRLGISLRMGLI